PSGIDSKKLPPTVLHRLAARPKSAWLTTSGRSYRTPSSDGYLETTAARRLPYPPPTSINVRIPEKSYASRIDPISPAENIVIAWLKRSNASGIDERYSNGDFLCTRLM